MELEKIKKLAQFAHGGQFRRDGVTPYFTHLQGVADMVEGEPAKKVAYLHDFLEDTNATWQDLHEFGIESEVAEAVRLLTKVKGQPYEDYLSEVSKNALATEVKIADMTYNYNDSPSERQKLKYEKGFAFFKSKGLMK